MVKDVYLWCTHRILLLTVIGNVSQDLVIFATVIRDFGTLHPFCMLTLFGRIIHKVCFCLFSRHVVGDFISLI